MKSNKSKEKSIITRVPFELWQYIKRTAVNEDTSVNAIVTKCLMKYKNNREKRLTNNDSMI